MYDLIILHRYYDRNELTEMPLLQIEIEVRTPQKYLKESVSFCGFPPDTNTFRYYCDKVALLAGLNGR